MKEIMSSNVIVQKKFTMRKMLEVYQTAKQLSGTTYLYNQQKAVDASNLTKLVSFLLTVKPQTTLKIIVEGTEVEECLNKLTKKLTNETSVIRVNRKRILESTGSFQV